MDKQLKAGNETIRVITSATFKREVEAAAARHGQTVSEYVRGAVRIAVAQDRCPIYVMPGMRCDGPRSHAGKCYKREV